MHKPERGLVHLYWGEGKGKTTAAMGLAVRALGRGMKVSIVQFLKDGDSGELAPLRELGAAVYSGGTDKFVFQMTPEEAEQATEFYRQRYAPIGKFECSVYPGIPQLLRRLHETGRTVILATSKPEGFAREILEHFDLLQYFDLIGGATLDGSRDTKEAVLQYILDSGRVPDRQDAVMIGDTKFDMIGAAAFSLPAVGVLYGFGSRQELEENGALFLARDAAELERYLFEE